MPTVLPSTNANWSSKHGKHYSTPRPYPVPNITPNSNASHTIRQLAIQATKQEWQGPRVKLPYSSFEKYVSSTQWDSADPLTKFRFKQLLASAVRYNSILKGVFKGYDVKSVNTSRTNNVLYIAYRAYASTRPDTLIVLQTYDALAGALWNRLVFSHQSLSKQTGKPIP